MNIKDIDWKNDINWKYILTFGLIGGGSVLVISQASKIIKGLMFGFLLTLVAFGMTWYSVKNIKENSATVASLELMSAVDVSDSDKGMIKIDGEITPSATLSYFVNLCDDSENCGATAETYHFRVLLKYDVKFEQLQVVEKTIEDEDSDGNVTTRKEYSEDWVVLKDRSQSKWAEISMAEISLDPEKADLKIDFEDQTVNNVFLSNKPSVQTYGQTVSDSVGDVRAVVKYLPSDDRDYIVVGELRNGEISSGETFIITDKDNDELVAQLANEEFMQRWGLRFVAFLVLTAGFTSMMSPVLVFTDLIPVVGKGARSLATMISAFFAAATTLLTVFLINYWWIVFIFFLLIILAIVFVLFKGVKKEKVAVAEVE